METLEGKKILLIAVKGISDGIKNKMEEMGAKIDHINDKPNNGVVCKTLGRYKVKPYLYIINNYYKKCIEARKNQEYDYILVIRGEYTPQKSLALLKESFPGAKLILYMWDSVRNNKGIENKWEYYDKVYTFDRIDYLNNRDRIHFQPLFYFEDMLPDMKRDIETAEYDIAFIGTGHEDRIKIIENVKKMCAENGLKIYTYIFLPHKLVYYYNKVTNKHFRRINQKNIEYKLLPIRDVYRIYSESRCVMDIESSTQCGLTMRTIEMIGLRKKLVTTNKDIVNYDFYNANNIMVVDRENFEIDENFFNTPYVNLDDKVYEKYALKNWILQVLR